jgi:hypothetical protein
LGSPIALVDSAILSTIIYGPPWSNMVDVYFFRTAAGTFSICREGDRFVSVYRGRRLGSYIHPQFAVDDLVTGTIEEIEGVATDDLGFPEHLTDWGRTGSTATILQRGKDRAEPAMK